MASEIRVNSLTNRSGLSTVTIADTGAVVAGIVTATTFSGPLTGAVTGNVTGDLTGNVTGNVTGNITGNVTGTATTATALSGSPSITVTDITATGNVSIGGTLTYEDVTNIDSVGIITAQSDVHVGAGLSVVGITTTQSDVLVGRNLSVTSGISTVKSLDYAAIDSTISGTAVDVFIYDTSKDSDGGAWRKRTQHTSWYNETLNTSTRGSRKEFPAVAVIVTTATNVTIYDGDDPDLPMWMDFQSGSYYFIGPGNRVKNSAHMLNGILCVTKSGSISWMSYISFVDDKARQYSDNDGEKRDYLVPISYRNASNANSVVNSIQKYTIVNDATNDVAMTVLPNAPIDDATGLPVPTIAVATEGGISIIKDDETIVDMVPNDSGERPATEIGFTESNKIVFKHEYNWVYYYEIPNGDLSAAYWNGLDGYIGRFTSPDRDWDTNFKGIPVHAPSNTDITTFVEDRALGHGNGLNIIDINKDGLLGYGMQSGISTDFNTGYQHGDIKGAFLSDTDTTNLSGSELVTNGTFDSDVSGWTTGTSTITYNSGAANLARNNASNAANEIYQDITGLTVGQKYLISIKITALSNLVSVYFDPDGADPLIEPITANATGTHTAIYTATQTSGKFSINATGHSTATATVDDVSMRVAELDRSVNNKGLQVFGTITKSAVATGADLVAYSGFNSNNYLQQPVNSDFEFGTGDWAFYGWYSEPVGTSGQRTILEIGRETVAGDHIGMRHDGSNLELFISDDSFGSQDVAEYAETPNGEWRFACGLRRGNQIEIYSNGVLKVTTNIVNATNALGDNQSYLRFGNRTYVNQPWDGSLALWRVSKSAPSAEQVKKIYEDEKHLFQENAKATLYGSSDAVTALAYDDDTDLLHVGTSSGRSDFQGLRRINNTTTAVTTAITAQNEFIIEQ